MHFKQFKWECKILRHNKQTVALRLRKWHIDKKKESQFRNSEEQESSISVTVPNEEQPEVDSFAVELLKQGTKQRQGHDEQGWNINRCLYKNENQKQIKQTHDVI